MRGTLILSFLFAVLLVGSASAKPEVTVFNPLCFDSSNGGQRICFYGTSFSNEVNTPNGKEITNFKYTVDWEVIDLVNDVVIDSGQYHQKENANGKTSIERFHKFLAYDDVEVIEFFNQIIKRKDGEIQFNKVWETIL